MTLTRPLRILIVGDYPDDARLGSAKVAHKLSAALRELGHPCDAFYAHHIGAEPADRQRRQLVAPVLAARAVARAISLHDYDIVDIASAEGLWIGVARRLGRFPDVRFICRSHGLEHLNYARMLADAEAGLVSKPWTRRIWYPLSRLSQVAAAARVADRMIVLNDRDRAYVVARGWKTADLVEVVPHGVSDRYLEPAPEGMMRGGGALFCATWDHMKGIRYLCDAWGALARAGRHIPLTVLGPGVPAAKVLSDFPEAARPLVTVIDRAPEEQVFDAYRSHDLLVFPSSYEGFGLVVIEAMAQSLPVVGTAQGCAASLLKDGETGLVVPTRDAAAIASAVTHLMDDPFERRRLGQNAAHAVSALSWKRTAEQTLGVYYKAFAGRVRSSTASVQDAAS